METICLACELPFGVEHVSKVIADLGVGEVAAHFHDHCLPEDPAERLTGPVAVASLLLAQLGVEDEPAPVAPAGQLLPASY
jgi:hypothetical protein